MLGGNYLININKNIQFGPAVYGAVTGKRGGFFTGGAELSGRYEVMPKVLAQAVCMLAAVAAVLPWWAAA
jgi:hypothetical protein